MRSNLWMAAGQLIAGRKQRQKRYATAATLGLAVAFSVFYLLALPAVTMEGALACQASEHAHLDACYGDVLVCERDAEQATTTLTFAEASTPESATMPFAEEPTEELAHIHTEECYIRGLVCGQDEHVHTDICYSSEMMMAMEFGIQSATSSSDLAAFLQGSGSIKITDTDGKPIPDGVIIGQEYLITLLFQEDLEGLQFAYHDGVLTYQLPHEILIPSAQSGPVLGEGGAAIGLYAIDVSGRVTVRFDNVDTFGNATGGQNFIDFYSNAFFSLEIRAKFAQIETGKEIEFGDKASIVVTLDDKVKLNVVKEAAAFNAQTNSIGYTIKMTALNGTIDLDKLQDDLWQTGSVMSGTLQDLIKRITIDWTHKGEAGQIIYDGTNANLLTIDGYHLTIPLTGITLDANETAIVTYTLDLTKALEGKTSYDGVVGNTATVTGKDTENRPVTGEDEVQVPLKKGEMLSKIVESVGENANGVKYIRWYVRVGDGVTDLRGATITDTFGAGLVFDASESKISIWDTSNGGNRPIFSCDWMNHTPENLGDHLSNLNGDPYHQLTVNVAENRFTYEVPDTAGPITSLGLRYVSVFKDQAPAPTGTFTNTIGVQFPSGSHEEYTGSANVGPWGARVDKTSRLLSAGDADCIEYTIEYTIPGALNGQWLYIRDTIDCIFIDEKGNSVRRSIENTPYDITVMWRNAGQSPSANAALDPSLYTFLDSRSQAASDLYSWTLCFVGNNTYPHIDDYRDNSKSPFKEDTILTVTYKIPLSARLLGSDREGVDTQLNMTLGEAMRSQSGTQTGSVYNLTEMFRGGERFVYDNDTRSWPVRKSGKWESEQISYSVPINPAGEPLASGSPLTLPVFIDTFDSRLELVAGSFNIIRRTGNVTNATFYLWKDGQHTSSHITDNGDGTSTMTIDFSDLTYYDSAARDYRPITEEMRNGFAQGGFTYTIAYKMKIRDKASLEPGLIKFNNTASITLTYDGKKVTFGNDCTMQYGEAVVTKDMTAAGNTATVEISINPKRLDLAKDEDTFVMHDKMSDTLAFYLSSIVVEYQKTEGGLWTTATLKQNSTELWGYTTSGDNELFMVLPDNTAIKITYKALIKGGDNETVGIKNEVWVGGQYASASKDGFVVSGSTANAGGSKTQIQIVKADAAQPQRKLDGAKFALYTGYKYAEWENTQIDEGIAPIIRIQNVDFYFISTGVTGAAGHAPGTYTFTHNAIVPNAQKVYALVEIAAPEGYMLPELDDDRITLVYFDALSAAQNQLSAERITDFVNILNSPYHTVLPSTGGGGTARFTLAGLALTGLSGAAALLLGRKRRGVRLYE